MSFPMEKLLRIRENRERQAARQVDLSRTRLAHAQSAVRQQTQDIDQYQHGRANREAQLQALYLGRPLAFSQLENWQEDLIWMKGQKEEMDASLVNLEQDAGLCEGDLGRVREKHREMQLAKQKIETRKELWLKAEDRRLQRKEESELEESISHKRRL